MHAKRQDGQNHFNIDQNAQVTFRHSHGDLVTFGNQLQSSTTFTYSYQLTLDNSIGI